MSTKKKLSDLPEIKQKIRGCQAENQAPDKVFTGYDHSLTEEEKERYTVEQIRKAGFEGEISSIDVEHLVDVLNRLFCS